ncbi:MAG: hypothetical protein KUG72_09440 [Pseudomonadales bacterium]|nr:hypothetical protein [Pseudomonadales bacterium]
MESVRNFSGRFSANGQLLERAAWYRSYRSQIFSATFVLVMVTGSLLNFIRPAIYRSEAVVLTTVQTEVDVDAREVDLEYVVIQQNLLTSVKLLDATLKRTTLSGVDAQYLPDDSLVFKSMMAIALVPETNLVELSIEGPDAEILPVLLNGLITTYSELRNEAVAHVVTNTNESLTEQKQLLGQKILEKREEIDRYRTEHNILSLGRDENQVYARLNGLTESLNKASEEVVIAQARRDAINAALARGEPIVPESEAKSLTALEGNQQRLQGELVELDSRYTREYMARRPSMQAVIQQLADVEKQIEQKISAGKQLVLSQIERDYETAASTEQALRLQLEAHKQATIDFTGRFAEHEALIEELLQLEVSHRELAQRLILIEIKQQQRYPQVEIIEPGYLPTRSVRPNYWRDTGFIFLLAFCLGLAAIWLYEFFRRSEKDSDDSASVAPNIFAMTEPRLSSYPAAKLEQVSAPAAALPEPEMVELDLYQMDRLLAAADLPTRQLIALLLSGFTPAELIAMSSDDIVIKNGEWSMVGGDGRLISLAPAVVSLLEKSDGIPLWLQQGFLQENTSIEEQFEAQISCAAVDAGIEKPIITSAIIRQAYIGYLVRQGIKLSELAKLVGELSPIKRAEYGPLSPSGTGLPAHQINPAYPALQNEIS